MRNHDEMIEELTEKLNAITQEDTRRHREATTQYNDARELLNHALRYRRAATYVEDDDFHRLSMTDAYNKIAEAMEDAAEILRSRGDNLLHSLAARAQKHVITIDTQE